MTCTLAPSSIRINRTVLSSPADCSSVLSTDQIVHSGFCRPSTFICKSPSDLYNNSPSSSLYSSTSNSPLSTNNNNQTTVHSPCPPSTHQPQKSYPLTPASTSSEPSPLFCPVTPSPYVNSFIYSPESPPNYWVVSTSSLVSGECDWREWIDEIVEEVRGEIDSETLFNNKSNPQKQNRRPLKRKESSASSLNSSIADSESSNESDEVPSLSKRAKKYSLSTLSHEQIAERKKEQNRIAAQRYRSRKNQTLEEGRTEINFLEKRNADLRLDIYAMEQEIKQFKQMLVNGPENVNLENQLEFPIV